MSQLLIYQRVRRCANLLWFDLGFLFPQRIRHLFRFARGFVQGEFERRDEPKAARITHKW
jgi:hypothetical protein